MLRRLTLSLLVALAPSIALAQFAQIAPTPATSDNGDRIANTEWVRNFFATGLPLASGKIFIGSVSNVATAQTPSGDCTLVPSGVITCTQAAGNFTVIGNLSVGGSIVDGNGILMTNIVAPATPAAGTTRLYVDSTNKVLSAKNDAGTVSNTVVPSTAPSNQFATGLSAAGVIAYTQPSFANLSGSWTCAQAPAFTGNVTTSAGACVTTIAALAVTNGMLAGSIAAAKLVGTDIATVGTITTGTWNGTKVAQAYGGTNADLSATGGTSQFLKQASVGAPVTVVRPACSDLSNAAASCSTDTTVATNISSGTLPAARLPNPTASTLGGIQSLTCSANQWLNTISTSGVPACAQPAFTNISGSVAASQLPNPSASTLGGIQSAAAVSNQWIASISTSGVPALSQPAFSNISGSLPNSQLATMATNTIKANVTSGTAVPTDVAVSTCSGAQNFLQWLTNAGPQCGTAPSWTIDSGTVTSAASKTVTITGSPASIMILVEQYDPVTAGSNLSLRLNGDSGANYTYTNTLNVGGTITGPNASGQSGMPVLVNVKAGFGARATIMLNAPLNAALYKLVSYDASYIDNAASGLSKINGSGMWSSSAAITSITLIPSSGNISTMRYQVIGYL